MPPHVRPIRRLPDDPDERYRILCGEALAEHMDSAGVSRKELVRRLADAGHATTLQSVAHWLNGSNLPRPSMQVAIARALGVRPRSIFDIDQAAAATGEVA